MPHQFHESNITWDFDPRCRVLAYDASRWYRKHFIQCEGSAAVDFVAVHDGVTWLIEAKDFTMRSPDRGKGPLWERVTRKVLGTLSGLVAGACKPGHDDEKALFQEAVRSSRLRVVFHCERPTHRSRLFKSLPDHADLQQKLRQRLRPVDSKVHVVDCASSLSKAPWTTEWAPMEVTA